MRLIRAFLATGICAIGAATGFACSAPSDDPSPASDESNVNGDKDVFAASAAFSMKLSAPFAKLFARYKAGQADPPDADAEAGAGFQEPEFSEPAQLVFTQDGADKTLDLRVYIRGESSKNDCPFPKLKLDFSGKDQLKKTPFKGHGKLRLNTHCGPGDASARSGMGRVMNGVGPVREELTYRLIRGMGIPTYLTRVAQIHYTDTGDGTEIDTFGMLMESGEDAAQRFGKMTPPLIDPEKDQYLDPNKDVNWSAKATPENDAQVTVAEAFSGNKDWGGTHNVDAFGVPQGPTIFKIAEDFDLGAIVLADIAHYWKGVAPVSDAKAALGNAAVAATLVAHKSDVKAAYDEAEKAAIEAKAVATSDGATTTDPGFLEAQKRIGELYGMPELAGAPAPDAGDAGVTDGGGG